MTKTKQTTRTGIESQKCRSLGELSVGRGRGENGGKGTGNKKHNWQAQNRQGDFKDSTGNGETKELIYTTHGHELRGRGLEMLEGGECRVVEDKREKKIGQL